MSIARRTRPLDGPTVAALRDLIAECGSRQLSRILGVPRDTLDRAAAGSSVLAGSRTLIAAGMARVRAARERTTALDREAAR